MRRTHWLLLATGVLVIVLTTTDWLEDPPAPPLPAALEREPDLYMEDAEIRQFGVDGHLQYRLDATRIAHFPARDGGPGHTELDQPDLALHRQSGVPAANAAGTDAPPPWLVRAASGLVQEQPTADNGARDEEVQLTGAVTLSRRPAPAEFVHVASEQMTVWPNREFVSTREPVTITSHHGRTSAVGMDGNLATGHLRLYSAAPGSRVHTVIPPTPLTPADIQPPPKTSP